MKQSIKQLNHKLDTSMAVASPRPPWPRQRRHPLRPPLPPHLLHLPHGHLPPTSSLPRRGGDQAHPSQETQSLSPHCRCGQKSPILPNHRAKKPLRLLSSSCPHHVCHPCLCTALNKRVQVFTALAPLSSHIALQRPKALQPGHQSACLPRLSPMVKPVQPLQWTPI